MADIYKTLADAWGITLEDARTRANNMSMGIIPVDEIFVNFREANLEHMLAREGALSQSEHLASLGSEHTSYTYQGADKSLLETFPNPLAGVCNDLGCTPQIQIVAPEFTSLCPKTGQPDFATIVVEYTPRDLCVESKSYKLYLGSFRQTGEFHEACVARIAEDLVKLLDPLWLMVRGEFTPRGGIKFWPQVQYHGRNEYYKDMF